MNPAKALLGKTFGRLTVLKRAPNPGTRKNNTEAYWLCQCECGKTTVVRSYALTTGNTKSCGCLQREAPHLPFLPQSQPKYTAWASAARNAWRPRYLDLPFEDFCRLAQMDCYYCGTPPTLTKISIRKEKGIFKYNTLDRIDSSKGHTIDNVVPACKICNGAKLDKSMHSFHIYINNLTNNLIKITPEEYRNTCQDKIITDLCLLHRAQQTSIRAVYHDYHNGILTLQQFYQLTTSDCYYCGARPANKRNVYGTKSSTIAKENGTFIYNGLDRIDNSLPHDFSNVVPCCKYCNTAKGQLDLAEFSDWIARLAAHQLKPERFAQFV